MEFKDNRLKNLSINICLSTLLFLSIGSVAKAEDLGLVMNAPVNSELATAWIATLQKAYDSFHHLMAEVSRSTITLNSSTIVDFEVATRVCFSLIKNKVMTTIDEFKITARAVSTALAKAVVYGVRAVGELASKGEKGIAEKFSATMDLMQNALELTYNLIPLFFLFKLVFIKTFDAGARVASRKNK
uniref:Uncharacterized protein n=1 Tax=Strigamia maritima TaxID=126957 RepID=T1JDN1_STRMM